jgi:hypothetical protein
MTFVLTILVVGLSLTNHVYRGLFGSTPDTSPSYRRVIRVDYIHRLEPAHSTMLSLGDLVSLRPERYVCSSPRPRALGLVYVCTNSAWTHASP